MAAFNASSTTGLLYMSLGAGTSSPASSGLYSPSATPGAAASVRGVVDQIKTSEIHVGNNSAIEIEDTTGAPVATFRSTGAHNIGKSGQTTTMDGHLTVSGNLTVTGTTTSISATELVVTDKNIQANYSAASANAAVPTGLSGLSIVRGASAGVYRDAAALYWDETNSRWNFALNTANDEVTLGADLAVKLGALTATGNVSQTGATTFSTGTGAVSLNGAVTIAANQNLSFAIGTGAADFSSGSGIFKTSTGAVTIGPGAVTLSGAVTHSSTYSQTGANTFSTGTGAVSLNGDTTIASAKNLSFAGGASAADFSAASGVFKTTTGAVTIGGAGSNTSVNSTNVVFAKEVNHNIQISDSTTVSTVGGTLKLQGAAGSAGSGATAAANGGPGQFFAGPGGAATATAGGVAGTGGALFVQGGAGGAGAATTNAAGTGGAATFLGGDAGANGGAGGGTGGAARVDSGAGTTGGAVTIADTNAASCGIGRSGITTTVTGGLTQLTGAVSLTGNAASSFTTSAGALTLTSAAAATWSTTAGALTLTSAAACTWSTTAGLLTLSGAAGITLTSTGGTLTLNATGQSFNVTATTLALTGAMTVSSTLGVTGNATFNASVLMGGTDGTNGAIGSGTSRFLELYLYKSVNFRACASNNATAPGTNDAVAMDTGGTLSQTDSVADAALARGIGVYAGSAGQYRGSGAVLVNKRPTTGGGTPTAWESLAAGDVVYLTSSGFAYADETATVPTAAVKKGTISKAKSTTVGHVIYEVGVVTATSGTATQTATIIWIPRFVSVN